MSRFPALIFAACCSCLCFAVSPAASCLTDPDTCKDPGDLHDDGVSLLQHSARKLAAVATSQMEGLVSAPYHGASARADLANLVATLPNERTGFIPNLPGQVVAADPSCSPLTDHGAYFGVSIGVGTPRQTFEVVLDTGSNNVLVPWCDCHGCSKHDACYTPQASSTFHVSNPPPVAEEGFGSGIIDSVIISDVATVGHSYGESTAYMKNSLFLILEMDLTKQSGKIGGILGMGKSVSTGFDKEPSFMEESGLDRFSVCMQDHGFGALRLGSDAGPEPKEQLGSVGVNHWALGLTGVGIGNKNDNVPICTQASLQPGNVTPCSAIPDSGTTDILGPPKDLLVLFSSLCDKWPRCRASAENSRHSKSHEFQNLLLQCNDWINEGNGIHELPDVEFRVVGSEGTEHTISISPAHYTFSTYASNSNIFRQNLKGVFPEDLQSRSGKFLVCAPAFGAVELQSPSNGPIWVLGLPLFYSSGGVHFSTRGKGSVAFTSGSCQTCAAAPSTRVQSTDRNSAMPRFREGVTLRMNATASL